MGVSSKVARGLVVGGKPWNILLGLLLGLILEVDIWSTF